MTTKRRGATATTVMAYTAIQEQLDGKTVGWMKQENSQQDCT
jgi:hypothetical protein